jgi:hypothetical protein
VYHMVIILLIDLISYPLSVGPIHLESGEVEARMASCR